MKFALCVGINAYGGSNTLSGCVNDALDWQQALVARGFNTAVMLDQAATGDAIRAALKDAMSKARYGDRFIFTYSGHGTFMHDYDGDEADGNDEAICPVDCFTNGMIIDDEIANIFGSRRYGVRAVQVSDSCHSGTVSRFIGEGDRVKMARMIPPGQFSYTARSSTPRPRRSLRSTMLPHLLMGGCGDNEYSYDAWFNGKANGAFTKTALTALRANPKTYSEWQSWIRHDLPSDNYPQSPVLVGTASRKRWTPLG